MKQVKRPVTIFGLVLLLFILLTYNACGVAKQNSQVSASSSGPQAYISDHNGYIWKCGLNESTGTFQSCAMEAGIASGDITGDYTGITLMNLAGMTYAYVTNVQYNMPPITKCVIDGSTGELTSCSQTGNDSNYDWTPDGITFNSLSNGALMSYVADGANTGNGYASYIWQCTTNSTTGAVSGCSKTPTDSSLPSASNRYNPVILNSIGGKTYGYIADTDSGYIWECLVNSTTGAVSGCAKTPSDSSLPGGAALTYYGITFFTTGGVTSAYVADYSGSIWQCSVSSTTGALSGCAKTAGDGSLPVTLASYCQIVFKTFGGSNFAFIVDTSGNIWQCSVNSTTGAFNSCIQNDGGAGLSGWNPSSLTFSN